MILTECQCSGDHAGINIVSYVHRLSCQEKLSEMHRNFENFCSIL